MSLQESLPPNVQKLIHEYSKPITRANWRKGSSCNNAFKDTIILKNLHEIYKHYYFLVIKDEYKLILNNNTFIEDVQLFGENIYNLIPCPSMLEYKNFYFVLRSYNVIKKTKYFKFYNDNYLLNNSPFKVTHIKEHN